MFGGPVPPVINALVASMAARAYNLAACRANPPTSSLLLCSHPSTVEQHQQHSNPCVLGSVTNKKVHVQTRCRCKSRLWVLEPREKFYLGCFGIPNLQGLSFFETVHACTYHPILCKARQDDAWMFSDTDHYFIQVNSTRMFRYFR